MTSPAARRLGKEIRKRADYKPRIAFVTTVTVVTAGTSTDGTFSVSVLIGSTSAPAPYLAGYINGRTPLVGDAVMVMVIDGSPLILDRVRGFPSI